MRYVILSVLVVLALVSVPQQGHALSVTVSSATVTVGDTFSITLSITDAVAVDLTSFQFDLAYDSAGH
jgi:hypothetical protein